MAEGELHKIAEGREAEIFEWEHGTVLRRMRDRPPNDAMRAIETHAAALEAALAAGVRVPAPHGAVTVDGRPGLVMDRVDGTDLLTRLGRRPWTIAAVGRVTGRLHAELHEAVAPESLPDLRQSALPSTESDLVPAELARAARRIAAELPDGDRLCHGDLHPGNVLEADGVYTIIDWSNAARGDPAADRARTEMMLQLGEPPPGTSLLLRILATVGRRALLRAYRRGYREVRALDEARVRRWAVPVMVCRLSEDIPEERAKLLELIEARLRE